MEVILEVSKYDILGLASMIGADEKAMKEIEDYINGNESLKIDFIEKDDKNYAEYKSSIAAVAVAQISKNLNL